MQKDYREFTVGELLDLGLNVTIRKHDVHSVETGKEITRMFEGTKQSTSQLTETVTLAKAWKGNFNVGVFITQ